MFIRKTKKKDRLHLSTAKGIWDPEKKTRSVTVRSLGYADRLEEEHGDAMAYARRVLQECEAAEQKDAEEKTVTLTISLDREIPTLDDGSGYTVYLDEVRNLGYGILKEIYLRLELDRFWNGKARAYPVSFSVDGLFRLLVFGWALYPGSVAEILHRCRRFFEPTDAFSMDHVSQLGAIVSAQREELPMWILKHAADVLHGELSPEQRSSLQNPLAASSLDDTAGVCIPGTRSLWRGEELLWPNHPVLLAGPVSGGLRCGPARLRLSRPAAADDSAPGVSGGGDPGVPAAVHLRPLRGELLPDALFRRHIGRLRHRTGPPPGLQVPHPAAAAADAPVLIGRTHGPAEGRMARLKTEISNCCQI